MTLKPILRPVLRVLRHFIPLYWLLSLSSKFKVDEARTATRASIRVSALLFGMVISTVAIGILLTPVLGQVAATALAIIAGIGIMPGLCERLAKHAIRAFSWLKNRNNPQVINKTYPQKYKAVAFQDSQFPAEFRREQRELVNSSIHQAMRKLYVEKQQIKNNPEGWLGLSKQQKEQCKSLNVAIGWFRQIPMSYYQPDFFSNPQQKNPITPEFHLTYQASFSSERGLVLMLVGPRITPSDEASRIARKSAVYANTPILIKKGAEYSIYGYQDGKWQKTKLDNLSAAERITLDNVSFIGSDITPNSQALLPIVRKGHTPNSERTNYLMSVLRRG